MVLSEGDTLYPVPFLTDWPPGTGSKNSPAESMPVSAKKGKGKGQGVNQNIFTHPKPVQVHCKAVHLLNQVMTYLFADTDFNQTLSLTASCMCLPQSKRGFLYRKVI